MCDKKTEENKRKELEAPESRGSRYDAQFAADWDATIERLMTRLREQPLDG